MPRFHSFKMLKISTFIQSPYECLYHKTVEVKDIFCLFQYILYSYILLSISIHPQFSLFLFLTIKNGLTYLSLPLPILWATCVLALGVLAYLFALFLGNDFALYLLPSTFIRNYIFNESGQRDISNECDWLLAMITP